MNGTIEFESPVNDSEIGGPGTTFSFVVRLAYEPAGDGDLLGSDISSSSEGLSPYNDSTEFHILLAEDNTVNSLLAVELLKKGGYEVTAVEDGRQAVDAFRDGDFGLIFMDVQMPVLGGLEATWEIRQLEKSTGGHIPIVAMTANAMSGDREECFASGMDGYICKPIKPRDLHEAVERALRGEPITTSR
jgi:CheY-like chemotaxis protein